MIFFIFMFSVLIAPAAAAAVFSAVVADIFML